LDFELWTFEPWHRKHLNRPLLFARKCHQWHGNVSTFLKIPF
jgi:hypothetical protein